MSAKGLRNYFPAERSHLLGETVVTDLPEALVFDTGRFDTFAEEGWLGCSVIHKLGCSLV